MPFDFTISIDGFEFTVCDYSLASTTQTNKSTLGGSWGPWICIDKNTDVSDPDWQAACTALQPQLEKIFRTLWARYEAQENARIAQPKKTKKPTPGYIYLIRSMTGYYKIGKSKEPERRIKSLGVQLPFAIEPVAIIETDNMRKLERELHQKFDDQRGDGEWFALTPGDVQYIKGLQQ